MNVLNAFRLSSLVLQTTQLHRDGLPASAAALSVPHQIDPGRLGRMSVAVGWREREGEREGGREGERERERESMETERGQGKGGRKREEEEQARDR